MRHCIFILAIIVLPAARPIEVAPMTELEKFLVFTSFLVSLEELQFSESDLVHLMLSFHMLACTINAILRHLKHYFTLPLKDITKAQWTKP